MLVYKTANPRETFALGEQLGAGLALGDVICLNGDLGAGKTLLVQGIAAGLGICEGVTSPTYTILHVYDGGRLPIFHFDLYRLEHPDQLDDIGFEEYSRPDGVAIIEWADKFAARMPEENLWVELKVMDGTSRSITLKPAGPRYEQLCEELKPGADSRFGHGHSCI
ncbi:MAG: tRNA (adenosine(37)-N6)-threonylcarbamoyltransferase complex ATPase subunit type 1 TsaE [Negativicutes bacterium]|nr:tRNA (adenosine(37)-N6)-threonylcarbamoyltransferase complex ATPase subunit type 1 TsaE [Negativicutes bacterium]